MSTGEESFDGRKRRNLALAHDLARRMLDAYGGWVDEVEKELGATD
jgi:hypothetical protein